MRHLPLAVVLTFPLWGCPPNLTGEPCDSDCACPSGQSCLFAAAGDAAGTCQNGTNTCASLGDGGLLPDAGDAGDAGAAADAGDAGDAGSSSTAFQGVVVLNGGAVPPNTAKVYGFADGVPLPDQSGVYAGAGVTELTNNQGVFVFPNPVAAPTGTGYRFVAVYDTKGRGDYSVDDQGIFWQFSATNLAPGSSQALDMRIDVQTSTCYSVTADFQGVNGAPDITYLVGVGAIASDIHTGAPLDAPGDFDTATATFDAGSSLPAGFIPLGALPLAPVGSVQGIAVSNSWLYAPPRAVELSNSGTFLLSLSDSSHEAQQYPAGTCAVSYEPPPGFPSNLTLDGQTSNALWQPSGGGSSGGSVTVTWSDAPVTDASFLVLGDLVSIVDENQNQLLPDAGLVTSPLRIPVGVVPPSACAQGSKPGKFCALEITTLYLDGRKPRSTPYEGGTTVLLFQRSTSGG